MVNTQYSSVAQLESMKRSRLRLLTFVTAVTTLVAIGAIGAMALLVPNAAPGSVLLVGAAFLALVIGPAIIWNRPRVGFFFLIITAVLCSRPPAYMNVYTPTSFTPVWLNISIVGKAYGTTALEPFAFSLAEAVIVLTALAWVVRAIALRQFRPVAGPFLGLIVAYTAVVASSWVYGIVTGGDLVMSLYEIRPQFHFLIAYILATNLLVQTKEPGLIVWMIVVGAGILGIGGTLKYLFEGPGTDMAAIMPHPDSLSISMVLMALALGVVTGFGKRLTWVAALLTPTALIALLANQRRASIAAFVVALVPLAIMAWSFYPERRKRLAIAAAAFLAVSAVYLPLAWNASGPWALPARAIRSRSDPNERDNLSNAYRGKEEYNLKVTRDARPWLGIGYGKPFAQVIPLPKTTTSFVHYMPHNGLMWVWFRTGHVGFFCFLMLIATILIRGTQIARACSNPFHRGIATFAVLYVVMVYTFGKYDLLFVEPSHMFILGSLAGVLAALAHGERPRQAPDGGKVEPASDRAPGELLRTQSRIRAPEVW